MGLVLLVSGVGVLAWAGAASALKDIPTGWATLIGPIIGALIGGLAIGWQARVGFKTLKLSQEGQAEIARSLEAERRRMDAISLSSALRGELLAIFEVLRRTRMTVGLTRVMADEQVRRQGVKTLAPQLPQLDCTIYLANAAQLGLLGPSVAADVALLYSTLLGMGKNNLSMELPPKTVSSVADGYLKKLKEIIEDIAHTSGRLKEFSEGALKSESLFSIIIERERASHGAPLPTQTL